jgi:YHS domain-containing protein
MSFHRIAFTVCMAALAAACNQPPTDTAASSPSAPALASAPTPAPTPAASKSVLSRVTEPSKVCMVNDQYMDKEQIPVAVGTKTYFGCCAMCKEKLEKSDAARTAIDPVSGARVDKATAVIGRDDSNKVYYFESEATMRRFTL